VGGTCGTDGGEKEPIEVIRRKSKGKETTRWVDNIKMDIAETGWGGGSWTGLAHDRDKWRALSNAVTNLRVP
jgi:hypothetical protein